MLKTAILFSTVCAAMDKARLALIVLLLLSVWIATNLVPILVLGLRTSRCEARIDTDAVLGDMLDGAKSRINQAMGTLVSTAKLTTLIVPSLHECWLEGATQATFDPFPLVAIQDVAEDSLLQGAGVITAPSDQNGVINSTNKVSFEVTDGSIVNPRCPNYLYGFTTQNLDYQSYCISSSGTVDYSYSPYSGPDYGLAQEELDLLEGRSQADFLPVFNIVGRQSLTYEVSWRCDASQTRAYGIGFAQTNLLLLSEYLKLLALDGIIFIAERSTGLLVACNIDGQTVNITTNSWGGQDQVRIGAVNATDPGVREVANAVGSLASSSGIYVSSNYAIITLPYEYEPSGTSLDWIIVVATKRAGLVETTKKTSSRADVAIPIVAGLVIILCVKLLLDAIERLFTRKRSVSVQQLQPAE